MAVLGTLWLIAVIGYFSLTTERQRENHVVAMWLLLLLPVIGYPLTRLLGL